MNSKTHQTSPKVHLFELDDFESLSPRVTAVPTVECGDAALPLYRSSLKLSISHRVAQKLGNKKFCKEFHLALARYLSNDYNGTCFYVVDDKDESQVFVLAIYPTRYGRIHIVRNIELPESIDIMMESDIPQAA